MSTPLRIGKLDAARRQLQAAIGLYFKGHEPVAIHTLAFAAFGVLEDLARQTDGVQTIHQSMMEMIKDEKKQFVEKKIREAGNFFKHGDRDPAGVLEFRSVQTEWLIFECCQTYIMLSEEQAPWILEFQIWMAVRNLDILKEPHKSEFTRQAVELSLDSLPRMEFHKRFLEAMIVKETEPSN
jgi:hypothetical protein